MIVLSAMTADETHPELVDRVTRENDILEQIETRAYEIRNAREQDDQVLAMLRHSVEMFEDSRDVVPCLIHDSYNCNLCQREKQIGC